MNRLAVTTVALLLLGGCAAPQVPSDHFYRLLPASPAARDRPLLEGTVEVGRFRADGLTADRPLVYTTSRSPHELQVYHYHQWIEPPASLLQDQLIEYLRRAGIAERVVTPELRANARYQVTGRLRRLEHQLGDPAHVDVEVELGLRASGPDRVELIRNYHERQRAEDGSIDGAVKALSVAVGRAFERFARDLETRR